MATTAAGTQLVQSHRAAQVRLSQVTAAQVLAVSGLLDIDDLDGTAAAWLRVVMPIVRSQRSRSARLSGNFYSTLRRLEGVPGEVTPLISIGETIDPALLATSLMVTGPHSIKKSISRGQFPQRAYNTAIARVAGAAVRHARNGGRETTLATMQADPQALGHMRVTSGSPCHFCAMLAARGPVYKDGRSASFKPHDSCNCDPEPVFSEATEWPEASRRFAAIYDEAKSSDIDTAIAFRQLIENRS